ncbi:tRNA (adenosine(37)-N6)-dimethylallyltransferase MiaA [Christensenellaceae bacterium OttesenSCG-928-L17]|nr:tRNA (adenosine(37)-N6)-dimethylallyltransferase MiaA [Christensenellaceae bacterium OttesenSCG-928-L17]
MKPKVYVIVGPTASGKTALSIALAKHIDGEIISADSIQIYKGLDIGSAKPTMAEREGIAHHMLDVVEISCATFSVAEYKTMAMHAVEDILSRNKVPIVAGGSGLYINALTCPLEFTSIAGDATLRRELHAQEEASPGSLYKMLLEVDAARAAQIHPNDRKRLVRALEIYRLSGEKPSHFGLNFTQGSGEEMPYTYEIIGISMPREQLYERINLRVDEMLKNGLLEETERIYASGISLDLPALQGLGYKQLLSYWRGEVTLEDAIENVKRETRRFAKRQMTWFLRDKRIRWIEVHEFPNMDELISDIIKEDR